MKFNIKLQVLRAVKQVSQNEVAAAVGIAGTTYANYEVSNRQPKYETLIKIAEYFEVSVDTLIKEDIKLGI